MKNKIILISGYCATGKSTFSYKLAEKLNLPCFNKDRIKEVIGDGFGAENKDVHKKNSAVTFMLMMHIAENFLKAGKPCILESNFKLHESEQVKKLLEKYNCECLTFVFTGDLEVVYERYIEREKTNRHWVHIIEGEDKEMFMNSHKQFGQADVSVGQTVKVNTTDFDKVDYEKLYDIAENFLN